VDFNLPELGEGVYEAELTDWKVKPGDTVKRGQPLLEVMTDKATMEVPAPFAGTIGELKVQPGQKIKVGQAVLTYTPAGLEHPAPVPQPAAEDRPAPAPTDGPYPTPLGNGPTPALLPVKAAPSVRYMARKLGIDLRQVSGSGPEGRILVEDLTDQLRRLTPQGRGEKEGAKRGGEGTGVKGRPRPDYGTPGTKVKLQGMRRSIAERMVQSKRSIPHYTYVDECDVTELVRLREGLRTAAGKIGVKLTYLPFFLKAVVSALKEVPLVNATLDEKAGEIVLHDRYDIGVAVAAPAGLIVPVVRGADRKDLFQLAREIERLSDEARDGKSRREDLLGGTFTVTSIGGIGGLFATPIINAPEVGILGIGKVVKRPVFDAAGNVRAADMVYLSLSFDHRVVDGAVGAVFGNAVIRQLQNPAAMLVPG
jgi:pyruvate dehydrogenase E2 component (dihydrolipoamide acetyltransferase)/2-oxoisovalerate dehydrogenase E2 component (dihydrolipoyl transacylase)